MLGYDVVHDIPDTTRQLGRPGRDRGAARRHPRAVLHVGRLLRDPPQLLRAQLGPRPRVLAAAAVPARHARRSARTSPPTRRARARSTTASARCSTRCTRPGWTSSTLVIFTTDHGLAFPTAKASLLDRGIGVMLIMRGPGFTGGRALDELVSHIDIFPTVCELAGIDPPPWLSGARWSPLVDGREEPGDAVGDLLRADLPRRLRAAAGDPHRALQVRPPVRRLPVPGAGELRRQPEQGRLPGARLGRATGGARALHDLFFNPGEGRNVRRRPDLRGPVLADLRERLQRWMWRPTTRCSTARSPRRSARGSTRRISARPTRRRSWPAPGGGRGRGREAGGEGGGVLKQALGRAEPSPVSRVRAPPPSRSVCRVSADQQRRDDRLAPRLEVVADLVLAGRSTSASRAASSGPPPRPRPCGRRGTAPGSRDLRLVAHPDRDVGVEVRALGAHPAEVERVHRAHRVSRCLDVVGDDQRHAARRPRTSSACAARPGGRSPRAAPRGRSRRGGASRTAPASRRTARRRARCSSAPRRAR